MSEYFDLTLSFIFQNLTFFRFSWHTIWWMCRAFTICLILTSRTRLSWPSRYLRHVRKAESYLTTKGYLQLENSTHRLEISLKANILYATMRLILCRSFQLQVVFCGQIAFTKTFLETIEKSFSSKHETWSSKPVQNIFWKNLMFLVETFLKVSLENVL